MYLPVNLIEGLSKMQKSAKYFCFLMSVENKKPPLGGNTTPPYRHMVMVAQHRALELSGQGSQENVVWERAHTYTRMHGHTHTELISSMFKAAGLGRLWFKSRLRPTPL